MREYPSKSGSRQREQARTETFPSGGLLFSRAKCLLELRNVVVKELEIIGYFFFTADRGHQYQHLSSRFASDRVRGLQVEVGFHNDDLYTVTLHELDQLDRVLRTGGDAGSRLDITGHIKMKMVGEIRPGTMIGDDLSPRVR